MKIKQPNYRCPVDCAADDAEIDVEIPTASLIAELEARRKCKECGFGENGYECNKCIWEKRIDNFTPTAKKERE